ncbi:MAG: VCBS domain-containing protein, partial [Methylococcales bacterium]|nr:VCBS domain-containing protein [Methylococcales bacterium]
VGATATFSDVDSAAATFLETNPRDHTTPYTYTGTYGVLSVKTNGEWTYTLDHTKADSLKNGQVVEEHFNKIISDKYHHLNGEIVVSVHGSNDGAIVGGVTTGNVVEDGTILATGILTISDVDTGEDHYVAQTSQVGTNGYGHFSVTTDGHWTYTLDNAASNVQSLKASDHVIDTLTVLTADGTMQVLSVNITGQDDNRAPTLTRQGLNVEQAEDTTGQTFLLSGATDPDGDTLSITGMQYQIGQGSQQSGLPAGFTLQGGKLEMDTTVAAYQHLAVGVKEQIVLSYNIDDGHGHLVAQTETLTIVGTNDIPVISTLYMDQNVLEDSSVLSGHMVLATDADTGDTRTFSTTTTQAGFRLNSDGSYTFDPKDPSFNHLKAGEREVITIPVVATDNHGGVSAPENLTITVTGVNDAP